MMTIWNYLKQNKVLAAILGVTLLGIVLYANTLNNQMFWDDNDFILNNQYVHNWKNIPQYFSENLIAGVGLVSDYWRPVLLMVFSVEYHLWGEHVFGYHLVNMLFHIANAILLFFLLQGLFQKPKLSLLTTLFFLIHPLQTEAVTYVNSLGDSLSVFFILLGLNNYLFSRQSNSTNSYWWSLVCFPLALMSKETAIVFPMLIALVEFFHNNTLSFKVRLKNAWRFVWPFLAIAVFYVLLRATILNFKNTFNLYNEANVFTSSVLNRIFTFFKILTTYVGLLFYPHNLHMERSMPMATSLFTTGVWQGALLFVAILSAVVAFWNKHPIISFGLLWFLIGLSPTSNIAVPINGLLYEHWLYLPMIGFWMAIFWFIFHPVMDMAKNLAIRRLVWVLACLIIAILGLFFSYQTMARNVEWRDPIIFYNQTLQYAPDSYRVINNLGMAYADSGDNEKAKEMYLRAIALDDSVAVAYHNLGNTYRELEQEYLAIENFKTAIKKDPGFVYSYNALIQLYLDEENYDAVAVWLEQLNEQYPSQQLEDYIKAIKGRLK